MSAGETTFVANVAKVVINPSTEEKQDALLTELQLKADLSETQPVSAASLPLPLGASTEAKQDDVITQLTTAVTRLTSILATQTDGTQISRVYDGAGNPLSSYLDATGKYVLNIHDADVHNILINRHFVDFDTVTESPTVAIVPGDTVILVADTTGFVVGPPASTIAIKNAAGDVLEHHFVVTAVVANTSITVDRPIDLAYTTSATLEVVSLDMNVVGSLATPISYIIKPPVDEVWHIMRVLLSMTDGSPMDDALFGGITALVNGVTLRENRADVTTLTNWKANKDMKEDMYDVKYALKAPAGSYGLNGRWTFKNAGVAMRLDGAAGDTLEILIQDDLTGLDTFRIKAQGHIE